MPIRREFLNWRLRGLAIAADRLMEDRARDGVVELSSVVVALPGGRAGRRLLEILVAKAQELSLALVPPEIITAGRLPELLYEARKPFADEFTQRLAWTEALGRIDRSRLVHFVREPPSDDDLFSRLALGEMLSRLHRELAADGLDFSDVVSRAADLPEFHEAERWQTLAEIQQTYLEILDGLDLWDLQTARLFAIRHNLCATEREIVLVGTVDLNRSQRAMLDQVAEQVTTFVFAPAELADRFDAHGCLISEAWQDVEIDLVPGQIEVVDAASDQADAVIGALAEFDGTYSAEEISIGVPDERLVASILQRLGECAVPARYGAGVPMPRSQPCLLLQAVADYLESRRTAAFAALVRHPAIARLLAKQEITGDWLTQLDCYAASHLPARLDGKWLGDRPGDFQLLRQVLDCLDPRKGLLHDLSGGNRPLGDWAPAVVDLLVQVFGAPPLEGEPQDDATTVAVCDKIRGVLLAQQGIPAELTPRVTGAEALRLLLGSLAGETIPPRADHSAIELLGWLELPLDDAPALIVSGFNEGFVPASRNSDLFLPNELRRRLGLEDNDRIYARDAYALSLIAQSRKSLKLVAGRRTTDNDPLVPSRLLFACGLDDLAQRTKGFLGTKQDASPRPVFSGSLRAGRKRSVFTPPHPFEPFPELTSMRVTEFRDYLACPYRYYLRHQMKLAAVDDKADELGGGEFGSLLHEVLKSFGESDVAASDVEGEIGKELSRLLDDETRRQFGSRPLSAVAVQIEQIRLRLRSFAAWQAEWVREGWAIQLTERNIADPAASLLVDDVPVFLRGRIDRIDRNKATGEIVVFDYKTGETAKKPETTHRKRDAWIDLQLPLYRHLIRYIDELADVGDDAVKLGYIVIPKSTEEIGHYLAGWTADDLQHADEAAREVVRGIRSGRFWPPADPPPAFFDEFAAICLDAQFGRAAAGDDAEDEQ